MFPARKSESRNPPKTPYMQFTLLQAGRHQLWLGFARVYEQESLSLWESRALRPGEGKVG